MPPDPVLALISFVGLIAYVAVGAVFSAIFCHYTVRETGQRQYARIGSDSNMAPAYFFSALLWPPLVVLCAIAGVAFIPIWIGGKISRYLTTAQLDRGKHLS